MKQIITIFTLCLMNFTFAQDKNARASMEVDGVCGMCKERIEKAAIIFLFCIFILTTIY